MSKSIDIRNVCNILGVTSRTLRFYESEGIISSTTAENSSRRQYSEEQIEEIKNVLVLRSLGMSVAKITSLKKNGSLNSVVAGQKSKIASAIAAKAQELVRLDEAYNAVASTSSAYVESTIFETAESISNQQYNIISECTDAFIKGDYSTCFKYFSASYKEHMPLSAFTAISQKTTKSLGNFISKEKLIQGSVNKNTYLSYIKYKNLGVLIKCVFVGTEIHGFWLNYYQGI